MKNDLGDAPIEEQFRGMMIHAMKALNVFFNGDAPPGERKTGIIMLVFPYNDHGGRCNYISNGANRDDVTVLLREQLARFEGQPEVEGKA